MPDAQEVPLREGGSDLRLLAALALFREKRISSGKGAEIAGLSKVEFIDALGQHGIPYFTETPAELEAQVKAVRKVFEKLA